MLHERPKINTMTWEQLALILSNKKTNKTKNKRKIQKQQQSINFREAHYVEIGSSRKRQYVAF